MSDLPAFVQENIDLLALNTLALPARARFFAEITSTGNLRAALVWAKRQALPLLILGGGSNVILAGDWPGLVVRMAIAGKAAEPVDGGALVTIGAGENWHALVQWTLANGLYGLENLTLIPGTAGAAPIQNIGAYGVEIGEHLQCVRGIDLDDYSDREFSVEECRLGYRDSIFKHAWRNRFVITEIVLRLRATFEPIVDYPTLRDALAAIARPTALDVERAVRQIRQSRLPDPAALPNAGSFFKNPVVAPTHFARLCSEYPSIPSFPAVDGVKIPAAWLVEQTGWKGRRLGVVGVHAQQALVLIHYRDGVDGCDDDAGGNNAGEDNAGDENIGDENAARALLALAESIQRDVQQRFAIALELEPSVYGSA